MTMTLPKFKEFKISYRYKNGFPTYVTVTALNADQAFEKAKDEVRAVYGSAMMKDFTFYPVS